MTKIGASHSLFLLLTVFTFSSCTKDDISATVQPETRTYALKTASGTTAGLFTIGSDKNGTSVVTIELDNKSHIHGTTYKASICVPETGGCYAKLADVNAVIGYSETTGVIEDLSGRQLSAEELFKKNSYELKISNSNGIVASGFIR